MLTLFRSCSKPLLGLFFVFFSLDVKTPGQKGPGPRRETITTAIISSVLLQLLAVSSYISAAVLPLNLLRLLCFSAPWSALLQAQIEKKTQQRLYFYFSPCVCNVINAAPPVYFYIMERTEKKYECLRCCWTFNLFCRMERLFNSSITRKSGEKGRGPRWRLRRGGSVYLDNPHLSASKGKGKITRAPLWLQIP